MSARDAIAAAFYGAFATLSVAELKALTMAPFADLRDEVKA